MKGLALRLKSVELTEFVTWITMYIGSEMSVFFKTLFKGKNFAVRRVRELGVNSILITILRF